MSDARMRFVEFERGEIDMETGEFPMILASDGEASDGDILSIEGAQFTSRAPLQLSHINDPTATLGSVSGFRRDLQSSPKRLRARGQIELSGDGPTAEIRRDLAHMIRSGHVTGISVRWEPMRYMRRTELPKEHYAHVADDEPDFRKRSGVYHERWRVLEGSIVAIPADKAAMVGRAEFYEQAGGQVGIPNETTEAVAKFWRAMAEEAGEREPLTPEVSAEAPAIVTPPDPESVKAAFAAQVRELREHYAIELDELEAILNAQREQKPEPTLEEMKATISTLEARLLALEGRVEQGAPPAPIRNVQDIFDRYEHRFHTGDQRILEGFKAYLDMRRGKVHPSQTLRQQLHAETEAVLREAQQGAQPLGGQLVPLIAKIDELVTAVREREAQTADKDKDKS